MTFIKLRALILGLIFVSLACFAQGNAPAPQPTSPAQQPAKPAVPAPPARKADHAASYYHYGLAHTYEQMVFLYGRSEYISKAIEEYRLALENDPSSAFLASGLSELYARTGRIRDAVLEAQDMIRRDPNNLEARKLLGRIYLRTIGGEGQPGAQSQDILKLAIEQYEFIVKLEPKGTENHMILGRLYMISKDPVKAEAEFKTALQLEPASEEAITALAYLYNEQGDTKRAVAILSSVPEAARTGKLYAMLGDTYEQQKDIKAAIAAYKQAVVLDHDNLDAVRGLAQSLLKDNQQEAALVQFLALEEADPQDPQPAVQASRIYQHMGKFDLALEQLRKAEPLAPDSLEIPYNESIILTAQGKYDDAAEVLKKIIAATTKAAYNKQEQSNRALFLDHLGNIYRDEGRPLLALETFRKIADLGGDESARGYQEIIETYREQKQWSDATKAAQEAVRKLPNDKGLKLVLATQLADDGKAEEGIQTARSLLKNAPEDRETYIGLSQIYARLKRWKEAEDALVQADKFSISQENKEYVLFLQGSVYERQKKYDLAEQKFRQILQQDPNNTMTLNYLGYMNADRNVHLEESLDLIKKALALDPQNGAYLDSLGWVYFRLGKYDEAEDNLRKASDKTPNDATVQDHLAELYAKTGRLQLAASHWERALDEWNKSAPADVDPDDVTRVQKKLETVKVRLAQQRQ